VILEAPDVPDVVAAVRQLAIPVVTLVTDLPAAPRIAYAGIDNRAAGATAAYLLEQWLADRAGDVLVVRGHGSFRGEDEREVGFRDEMRRRCPGRRLLEVVDEDDRADAVTPASGRCRPRIRPYGRCIRCTPEPAATPPCSPGSAAGTTSSSRMTWTARTRPCCGRAGCPPSCTTTCAPTWRRACMAIMQAQGALPGPVRTLPSAIQVITPHNAPPVEF
jgi:LacI family transcriptional regulator